MGLRQQPFCQLIRVYGVSFAVCGAVALMSAFSPHPAAATSLNEALSGLVLDHPQIRAAAKTLESSRKEIDRARAGYFPTVSATAEASQEFIDSPGERSSTDGQNGKASSRTPQTASVTVTQPIFDGFFTHSTVQTARLNKEIAAISLEGTRQNTLFDGINAYIDVLRQRRLVELARENQETIERQLNLEDERVQRGSGVAVDVLQAKSRLQIAKERRVSFEGALEDAISRYAQLFNQGPVIHAMTDPVPPVELIPSSLERAIEIATAENPAVNNASTTVEVARERRRTVRAELYPNLDLEGQFNFEKHSNAVVGARRDYALTLRASWDLFTGFSTNDSLTQATYDYRAQQDTHENTVRQVVEQTKLAWQSLLTATQRLILLENAVNIASEVFASRKKLREAGKETVINVLDAENEVNQAQINFTSASYDERVAVYQLLLSMGRLTGAHLRLAGG